jgi:hypothetical protein
MLKSKGLAIITCLTVVAGSVDAGDKACCATAPSRMECMRLYKTLSLTPEQKAKLESYQAKCEKEGCTKQSMDKFFQQAKRILSKDQYAQLKAECEQMHPLAPTTN